MTADHEPIAIVGMAGVYPKAPDKDTFWKNILDGVDAVDEAPADWHGDLFLDPDSSENDRVYTTKGGFLGDLATFDPLRHGVMPTAINGGEPDQFLALEMAANAIEDAGFDQRPVPGDRVAVILGRGTYINRGFTSVVQHGIMVDRFLQILKQLHPDTAPEELAEVKKTLKASLPPFNAEIAPALVPNLVTGRISNRLDFRGTNYIVDAACASSLIALERGVVDLRGGRCDMAIVGGVHASTPAPIYQIFCQLEALSKKGSIKPFSEEADGTLLGEGVGLLCIKRLSDAEAAGDRIYALVRGVGVASDGKGLGILAPRIECEGLALSRAYEDANVDPKTVGLIEAHGTATSVGDATEVEALSAQFGGRNSTAPDCALGAVKSMIGHCLPASGSAGLIKTAMALY
ncbi:MAG: polyketide synthase, partial [Pseudomonadota bacterium]|nr:polyketide synthase [Pseudomonadota bacterium]